MPIFILPFEQMTDAFNSFLVYLGSLLQEPLISIPILIYLSFYLICGLNRLRKYIIYGDSEIEIQKKEISKKDKLTLKERIMRFRGFDHYREKEDKK